MQRLSYVGVLVFILLTTASLEVLFRTRVYRRWRRLLVAVVPCVAVFAAWDAYAIAQGHWTFDVDRILGIYVFGTIPLDELLFFLTIPIASVLTLEAVRSARGWTVGDEAHDAAPISGRGGEA